MKETLSGNCRLTGMDKWVTIQKAAIVSIIRGSEPRELFKYFRENGYSIANPMKGIYYIEGNVWFPTQIVVTKELE